MNQYQIDPPDSFLQVRLTDADRREIYIAIGSDGLRAFRQSLRAYASVQNFTDNAGFLSLLDAGLINENGFPTHKGKALEAFLAG